MKPTQSNNGDADLVVAKLATAAEEAAQVPETQAQMLERLMAEADAKAEARLAAKFAAAAEDNAKVLAEMSARASKAEADRDALAKAQTSDRAQYASAAGLTRPQVLAALKGHSLEFTVTPIDAAGKRGMSTTAVALLKAEDKGADAATSFSKRFWVTFETGDVARPKILCYGDIKATYRK